MKYLVAIPCMDMMHMQFVHSLLMLQMFPGTEIALGANSLVYDTRNQLAGKAINEGFDRVLWLDSDMTFSPDLVQRLAAHLDRGIEFVSGLYMTRKTPIVPCIFSDVSGEPPQSTQYCDYPENSFFEIAACGFGGVMMTTDLLRRVVAEYGLPFSPFIGAGEDISFCMRCKALGVPMYCDSSIKLGHIAYTEITESIYTIERFKHEQEKKVENTEHDAG